MFTKRAAVSQITFLAVLCAVSVKASASTFDFTGQPGGVLDSQTLVLEGGTFYVTGGAFLYAGDFPLPGLPVTGGICALNFVQTACTATLYLDFDSAISDFSVETFTYNPGDSVTIQLFSNFSLLSERTITANTVVDFSGINGVTSVVFDDNSTGAGYLYGNFSFNAQPIPIPAALPLMLSALCVLRFTLKAPYEQ